MTGSGALGRHCLQLHQDLGELEGCRGRAQGRGLWGGVQRRWWGRRLLFPFPSHLVSFSASPENSSSYKGFRLLAVKVRECGVGRDLRSESKGTSWKQVLEQRPGLLLHLSDGFGKVGVDVATVQALGPQAGSAMSSCRWLGQLWAEPLGHMPSGWPLWSPAHATAAWLLPLWPRWPDLRPLHVPTEGAALLDRAQPRPPADLHAGVGACVSLVQVLWLKAF